MNCFTDADSVYITDVFAAGEQPIEGVSGRDLAYAITKINGKATFIANHEDIASIISSEAKEGDLFVFMGAGTITNWANQLPELLNETDPEPVHFVN